MAWEQGSYEDEEVVAAIEDDSAGHANEKRVPSETVREAVRDARSEQSPTRPTAQTMMTEETMYQQAE